MVTVLRLGGGGCGVSIDSAVAGGAGGMPLALGFSRGGIGLPSFVSGCGSLAEAVAGFVAGGVSFVMRSRETERERERKRERRVANDTSIIYAHRQSDFNLAISPLSLSLPVRFRAG